MLLAFCLLLGTAAWAQDGLIGCMKVIKCEEWVSLREQPDAKSACLVEVPLGALVENCREESKAFHYAEYGGMSGYIMAQYLEAIPEAENYLGDLVVAAQTAIKMYLLANLHENNRHARILTNRYHILARNLQIFLQLLQNLLS